MFKTYVLIILVLFFSVTGFSQSHIGSWGDQGNGTYINPVLNADYSDPDVIQVNGKYYMVCSEFHYMGMPVLESEDMVNWKIIAQIYTRLNFPKYDSMRGYGSGSWAPAIRFHDNKYWVYFCTPNEGLFMSNATDPAGPWSPLVNIKNIDGWEDPCPFWDDDGTAYLGHSRVGAGPIIIHKMSADGTELLDDGVTVYTGPVAEGTKIFKSREWYYISIPEGGVEQGWQTVLRSKDIYGPYEKRVVLETGTTGINGPHQGALVSTPKDQWWFYHFQTAGSLGRVVWLEPVWWKDGWPEIGIDIDRNGVGEPVTVWKKPDVGKAFPVSAPQSDDDFNNDHLGFQWQWNNNPDNSAWSLTTKPGFFALKALKAESLMEAKNTLTQKVMGNTGEATAALDMSGIAEGQKAGLASMSSINTCIGATKKSGKYYVFFENESGFKEQPISGKKIYLRIKLDLISNQNRCSYSLDNKTYQDFGDVFQANWGFWKGTRFALFSYNTTGNAGDAFFDFFKYDYDGPK